MKCHHCGKTTVVRTAGKGDEFLHRCGHCHGYHRFTNTGRHASGAINYRVTKLAPAEIKRAGPVSNRVFSSGGGPSA